MSKGGQTFEFLEGQNTKYLARLNGWECNVRKYYNLKRD